MTRSVHDALILRLGRLGGLVPSAHTPIPSRGAYVVLFEVPRPLKLKVGALGRVEMSAGLYAYVGRAARGLAKRMERHLSRVKNKRWHIDYLAGHREVRAVAAVFFPERDAEECDLVQALLSTPGARAEVPRFGASDCHAGCPAHLVRVG